MVLGENIGTTLTANLAAVVGNRTAKRVARIHFLINLFGALWMIWLIPCDGLALSNVFAAAGVKTKCATAMSSPCSTRLSTS